MNTVYDVIIVGGGPAGLSGALVLGRCDRRVLVCDDGRPRNAKSHAMHGFLSRDGTPPNEFLEIARKDLQRYPSVEFKLIEVIDVQRADNQFHVTTADGGHLWGKKLLLTTGLVDELPPIPGLEERWGTSVFPCPFCDAWEFRGQPMAVMGCGLSASCSFALEMLTWTRNLTLLTDAAEEEDPPEIGRLHRMEIRVDQRKIARVGGPSPHLEYIEFTDGERLACRALFILTNQHQRTPFAERLGARLTQDQTVRTDGLQHTRQRGVYVAGNASVGLQAAILATAEGFKAAYAINDELIDDLLRAAERAAPHVQQPR